MPSEPKRKLAAIMFIDMVGYTTLIQKGKEKAKELIGRTRLDKIRWSEKTPSSGYWNAVSSLRCHWIRLGITSSESSNGRAGLATFAGSICVLRVPWDSTRKAISYWPTAYDPLFEWPNSTKGVTGGGWGHSCGSPSIMIISSSELVRRKQRLASCWMVRASALACSVVSSQQSTLTTWIERFQTWSRSWRMNNIWLDLLSSSFCSLVHLFLPPPSRRIRPDEEDGVVEIRTRPLTYGFFYLLKLLIYMQIKETI